MAAPRLLVDGAIVQDFSARLFRNSLQKGPSIANKVLKTGKNPGHQHAKKSPVGIPDLPLRILAVA
jgi:hypothetical protein